MINFTTYYRCEIKRNVDDFTTEQHNPKEIKVEESIVSYRTAAASAMLSVASKWLNNLSKDACKLASLITHRLDTFGINFCSILGLLFGPILDPKSTKMDLRTMRRDQLLDPPLHRFSLHFGNQFGIVLTIRSARKRQDWDKPNRHQDWDKPRREKCPKSPKRHQD